MLCALLSSHGACFYRPDEFPFQDERYFQRQDESPDSVFYQEPRFVTHIDDGAIKSLTEYYAHVMPQGSGTRTRPLPMQCVCSCDPKFDLPRLPLPDILDICSSWISHLPDDLALGRVAGLGMNEA